MVFSYKYILSFVLFICHGTLSMTYAQPDTVVYNSIQKAYEFSVPSDVQGLSLESFHLKDADYLREHPKLDISDFVNLKYLYITETSEPIQVEVLNWLNGVGELTKLESITLPSNIPLPKINSLRSLSLRFNSKIDESIYKNNHIEELNFEDYENQQLYLDYERFDSLEHLIINSSTLVSFPMGKAKVHEKLKKLHLYTSSLDEITYQSSEQNKSINDFVLFSDSLKILTSVINNLKGLKLCYLATPNLEGISSDFFASSMIQNFTLAESSITEIPEGIEHFTSIYELTLNLSSLRGDFEVFTHLPNLRTLNISTYSDEKSRNPKAFWCKEKKLKKLVPNTEIHITK